MYLMIFHWNLWSRMRIRSCLSRSPCSYHFCLMIVMILSGLCPFCLLLIYYIHLLCLFHFCETHFYCCMNLVGTATPGTNRCLCHSYCNLSDYLKICEILPSGLFLVFLIYYEILI